MMDKAVALYRGLTRSGTRGVCLHFDASPFRVFASDMVCRNDDVLVRLVKLIDFSGDRRISTHRAPLRNSLAVYDSFSPVSKNWIDKFPPVTDFFFCAEAPTVSRRVLLASGKFYCFLVQKNSRLTQLRRVRVWGEDDVSTRGVGIGPIAFAPDVSIRCEF